MSTRPPVLIEDWLPFEAVGAESLRDASAVELRAMPSEEAYYWYSKCIDPHSSGQVQQALRVLLAAE